MLHEHQFGYIRKKSTETAVSKCVDIIEGYKIEHRYKIILLISFDISAAFDSIKWFAILECVRQKNIQPNLLNIVKSFLQDREIRFYRDEKVIRKQKLKAGVPFANNFQYSHGGSALQIHDKGRLKLNQLC